MRLLALFPAKPASGEVTENTMSSTSVQTLVSQPYKYGFVTDIESDTLPRGLNEETIRLISQKKGEPEFMLAFRLKAYRQWLKMAKPQWAHVSYFLLHLGGGAGAPGIGAAVSRQRCAGGG